MTQAVFARGEMKHLYLCRAIFHDAAINGIRLSFFSNCIMKTKQ
ncbi:hypothetical protein J2Z40_002483 [Cytobacillus eiseniae]|uniref:Uncharacterized protein n=1 Tax=Cytobacillus eiseniae TaxID=762947 RepID=A0ABS4RG76_9BACI|nr:RAxF-45 family protein [Cytobacillus eiseniae]MBP2241910.1 hypothetical protein [Cytobacillus eiseniae]